VRAFYFWADWNLCIDLNRVRLAPVTMALLAQAACLAAVALACAPPAHGQMAAHGEFELGGVEYAPWIAPAVFLFAGFLYSVSNWYLDSPHKIGDPGFRLRQLIKPSIGGIVLGIVAFGAVGAMWGVHAYELFLAGKSGHAKTKILLFSIAAAYCFAGGISVAGKALAVLVVVRNGFEAGHAPPVS